MYKMDRQMKIEDYVFPYGKLDTENEWVKLAELIPWDVVEERYAAQFVDNGHQAHSARTALGALLIKQRFKCSDEWVVRHVSENPYLQYFIGMKEYTNRCPFGASTMVAFRKRFGPEDIAAILDAAIPQKSNDVGGDSGKNDHNDPSAGSGTSGSVPNEGTLVMDATCCPADIRYPQDFQLLNQAREKLEHMIDDLCHVHRWKKPRMYRQKARKEYLNLSKSKKCSGRKLRKGIRRQLGYIRRDVGYIAQFVEQGAVLTQKQMDLLNVLTTLYEQQRIMYETQRHSVPGRIVSIAQPWVRPIVRGKTHANTEFGAKLHISVVDGYARIERLSFDAYNEAGDFWSVVARYRERYGCYPERILADKLYRSRETLAFCKEHGIRLTGPALGRPRKNEQHSKQAKQQEYQDICDRNIVEGTFGTRLPALCC